MPHFDRLALAPAFATFGVAATYTPENGAPIPCAIVWSHGDDAVHLFSGPGTITQATIAEVRTAEVPKAREGDTLTVDGTVYVVQSARQPDPDRLLWRLDLAKALAP